MESIFILAVTFSFTVFHVHGSVSAKDCLLPCRRGPCSTFTTRFFFNEQTHACETFTYGGCLGNNNNFLTKEDCEIRCKKDCLLEKQPGPCKAIFQRYFFSPQSGRCELFVYGGCLGNANNFITRQDCEASCFD